jgi:hypothetical protein
VARQTALPLGLLLALAACRHQAPTKSYDLSVRVEADPGQPVEGVRLVHAGHELGATGVDGRVLIRATGNEGERIDLDITCPAAYRSPEAPLSVTLRRGAGRPEYFAACTPLARKLVVAARLEHGAGLPIRYLGREVARTDSAGVAHWLVEAEDGKTVELTIDTSERPLLRPKSPTARFRIGDRDELVVLEQSFQSPPKPAVRAQRPSGPVRIR